MRREEETKMWKRNILFSPAFLKYSVKIGYFELKHTSMNSSSSWNQVLNPSGVSVLHLLQQVDPDFSKHYFGQLGQEFSSTEWQHDRVTYASTDLSMCCRLPDEFDRNSVDIRIHTHHRNKLEKSMSSEHRYSHAQAAWFKPWGNLRA